MDRPIAERAEASDVEGRVRSAPRGTNVLGRIVLVIVAIGAFGSLIAFGAIPRIEQQRALTTHTKNEMALAPAVSTVMAQQSKPIEEFVLPGSTQAIQDAPIYARVNGYLKNRDANIGDLVHKNQHLADIDTPELDQQVSAAQATVEQAHANLDNARQALDKAQFDQRTAQANIRKAKTDLQFYSREIVRYRQLAAQGAVSNEDCDSRLQAYNAGLANLDATQQGEKSAQASVNSARAAVHVAQAAWNAAQFSAKQYEATRSFKQVTAPFDGVVVRRDVDAGALISSGSSSTGSTLLFEIARVDVLRVFVYVPEQYVPYIHVNEKAALKFQEYPTRQFDGIVTNVSGGIDPNSRTLQVEIHVPNPKGELLPGMYASVVFKAPNKERLPVVPAVTLQTRSDGQFMYTVDDSHHVHMHPVQIGRDLGGSFEISKGIAAGDQVILSPSDELKDGMLVSPVVSQVPSKDKS